MCLEHNITYIPVDQSYPTEMINYISRLSGANSMISDNGTVTELSPSSNTNISGKDEAYILFTSGTTGEPKGVIVSQNALFNFIHGISEIIKYESEDRIVCLTTVAFDIFFLESIMAIYKGLTVILSDVDEQYNPRLMTKLIKDNSIDIIQMTPSRMQLLLNYDRELSCLKNVKEIMIGGEPFPFSLLLELQKKTTAKIYNMYGPTEATIWTTVSDLTNKDCIDIGQPIRNTEIYIVDEDLHILPNGQSGEICIAGNGLANGYVGREDLTSEKFIYLPEKPTIRAYRTGDLGRYLTDGNLEYLGRTDNQVKIRGHRIELEEIESKLNQVDGIKQSVVIALETNTTDKVLEAFYTSDINIEPKSITDYLSSKLPSYMIPNIFKQIEEFITTTNGKIDRKRVSECIETKITPIEPLDLVYDRITDIQKKVFKLVASNLDVRISNTVSFDTDLAKAGIDSITFINIVVTLENEFDCIFDDEKLLLTAFPTIKKIAEYVELKAVN